MEKGEEFWIGSRGNKNVKGERKEPAVAFPLEKRITGEKGPSQKKRRRRFLQVCKREFFFDEKTAEACQGPKKDHPAHSGGGSGKGRFERREKASRWLSFF